MLYMVIVWQMLHDILLSCCQSFRLFWVTIFNDNVLKDIESCYSYWGDMRWSRKCAYGWNSFFEKKGKKLSIKRLEGHHWRLMTKLVCLMVWLFSFLALFSAKEEAQVKLYLYTWLSTQNEKSWVIGVPFIHPINIHQATSIFQYYFKRLGWISKWSKDLYYPSL
jgi:hypothetical protein